MKQYTKPLIILLPVILVIGYYLVTLSNRSEFPNEDNKTVAAPAAFETLEYKELTDWKGAKFAASTAPEPIVIMHFWASWCEPCIHEFPDLIKMAKAMKGKVKVFAISEDTNKDEVKAFIKSFKDAELLENFHIVWDENHEIMNKWVVDKLPESYIFGPKRKLAKHVSGVVSWTLQDTYDYFKMLETVVKVNPQSESTDKK